VCVCVRFYNFVTHVTRMIESCLTRECGTSHHIQKPGNIGAGFGIKVVAFFF